MSAGEAPALGVMHVEEVARELRVDPQTVRRFLRDGVIRGRKIGRRWVVTRRSLDEAIGYAGEVTGRDEG